MANAKKIETFYDKYFNTVVYEYRGRRYEVEYAKGQNVCCTPAWIQHRDAQEKIDKELDTPIIETELAPVKSFSEQMDEIYDILGW